MDAKTAAQLVEHALSAPIVPWSGYDVTQIPFVIYDDHDAIFINHPNPPAQRPERLAAATAVEINGVQTATIPSEFCETETNLIPLMYHEGFHVYQNNGAFASTAGGYNFFRALAFYPELDGEFRGLCAAEAEVYNNPALPDRPALLAALATQKLKCLTEDVAAFERNLERTEGTAAYIERTTAERLFNVRIDQVESRYGWARQYTVGAAACRFLERVLPGAWQKRVEAGESPSDILIATFSAESVNLESVALETKITAETQAASALMAAHQARIDALIAGGVLRIRWPGGTSVMRAFSPNTMISLGDGRMMHPEWVKLYLPQGKIEVNGLAVEDIVNHEVMVAAAPYTLEDGRLIITAESLQIDLTNVTQIEDNVFEVIPTESN